ncbi:MAG: hypothetical protein OXH29_00835 [bacterium]|nr:hypothetical protein [bacterium]
MKSPARQLLKLRRRLSTGWEWIAAKLSSPLSMSPGLRCWDLEKRRLESERESGLWCRVRNGTGTAVPPTTVIEVGIRGVALLAIEIERGIGIASPSRVIWSKKGIGITGPVKVRSGIPGQRVGSKLHASSRRNLRIRIRTTGGLARAVQQMPKRGKKRGRANLWKMR